jgi:hypothetical protein
LRHEFQHIPESGTPVQAAGAAISGTALLVLKHFLMCRCQPGTVELLSRRLHPEAARALSAPEAGHYYPDAQVAEIIHAVHVYLADGDLNRFSELTYEVSLFGMRHGFRRAVELGDLRQTLDRVPELWSHLEPHHPTARVSHRGCCTTLTLNQWSLAADPLRERTILAVLRALVFASTGHVPRISVRRDSSIGLAMRVERGAS